MANHDHSNVAKIVAHQASAHVFCACPCFCLSQCIAYQQTILQIRNKNKMKEIYLFAKSRIHVANSKVHGVKALVVVVSSSFSSLGRSCLSQGSG